MTRSTELSARRILCVSPRYEPSFGTFEHAYYLAGTKAFMPPLGLLTIAAYLPAHWEVRFIDENHSLARDDDFAWADAIFCSGMHIQRAFTNDICRRAHAHGKIAVLGGPSVSACPDYYPDFDILHCGELGDATDAIIAILGESVARPPRQLVLTTKERLALADFPAPAYELAAIPDYMISNVQFSSGCPYKCEFCDIPGLYGRVPRLKPPEKIIAELDKLMARGAIGLIYFVDDNFIGNRKAARELLPHLIEWQKRNRYQIGFSCEATLNIARDPEILAMMREAGFDTIFCGIESSEAAALDLIDKNHNLVMPILDAVKIINDHGMQVTSGILLGLDTDSAESGPRLVDFVAKSNIPLLTINLLQALPKTPLWTRLEKAGRLLDDERRESNIDFLMPYDEVIEMWRETMLTVYAPETLFDRYRHQMKAVWPNRIARPFSWARLAQLGRGLSVLRRTLWTVGVRGHGNYRAAFWKFALPLLRKGQIEPLLMYSLVAHHLIIFCQDVCAGRLNASHYSVRLRTQEAALQAAE